jgi:hypothetical protein
MENIFEMRVSDYILNRNLNPLKDKEYGKLTPDQLIEWCGIIPDFFANAVTSEECAELIEKACNAQKDNKLTDLGIDLLQNTALFKVADKMDEAYGWSAFGNSVMTNIPSDFGIIFGTHGEPDLNPLAKFNYEFLEVLVYEYGLVALRIFGKPNTVKFGRFD